MSRPLAILCLISLLGRPALAQQPSIEHERLAELLAERDRLQKEIESLCDTIKTREQIVVKLEMLEVNLTKLRDQGLDIPSDRIAFQSGRDGAEMAAFLKEIRKGGWSRTLSSPTLVTASGRLGSFFVGQQLPVPAAANSGKTVGYVEAGQRLDVLPEALGNNKVKLHIRAKVSTGGAKPDALQVEGQRIPSLEELAFDSCVEMPFGETWVLGGLVSRREVAKQGPRGIVSELQDVALMIIVTPEYLAPKVAQLGEPTSTSARQ